MTSTDTHVINMKLSLLIVVRYEWLWILSSNFHFYAYYKHSKSPFSEKTNIFTQSKYDVKEYVLLLSGHMSHTGRNFCNSDFQLVCSKFSKSLL